VPAHQHGHAGTLDMSRELSEAILNQARGHGAPRGWHREPAGSGSGSSMDTTSSLC
jgi:hypothetical protein